MLRQLDALDPDGARMEAERQIRASLREQEVLHKEIHHRIEQNLPIHPDEAVS